MSLSNRSSFSVEKKKSEMAKQEKDGDSDSRLLRDLGYTQELYRGFSPFMSFAFCFTTVNVLTSISIGFTYALYTGGSGVIIWSWMLGSLFTILIGLSLAEICSVYPSAGSVYHWYCLFLLIHHYLALFHTGPVSWYLLVMLH
jgi:amino acid permease